MKNYRRIAALAAAFIMIALSCSSCGGLKKLEEIKVTSFDIAGISPHGFRNIDFSVNLGVDNPGTQISLSELSCDLKDSGKVIGNVIVDPFTLHAKSNVIYPLKASLSLEQAVNFYDITRLVTGSRLDSVKVDVHAKLKLKSGASRAYEFKDIPLKQLLERTKSNEK